MDLFFAARVAICLTITALMIALYVWSGNQIVRPREERKQAKAQQIADLVKELANGKRFDTTRTNEHTRKLFLEEMLVAIYPLLK